MSRRQSSQACWRSMPTPVTTRSTHLHGARVWRSFSTRYSAHAMQMAYSYLAQMAPSSYADLRKFLDTSVSSISGHIAGATYRAGEPGAQATAQSERIRSWLAANRFQAVSQASMMSARLRNTELASQWLRR